MSDKFKGQVSVEWFLERANKNEWDIFDRRVLEVCNDEWWFNWAKIGLQSERLNERDLAISILEKTNRFLSEENQRWLNLVMSGDENMHLRRKAAIALFKHGVGGERIVNQMEEARLNDEELSVEASEMLGKILK